MEFNTTNIATASLSVIVSLLLVAYFSKYYLLFRAVLGYANGQHYSVIVPEHWRQRSGNIKRQQCIFVSDSIYVLPNMLPKIIHLVHT